MKLYIQSASSITTQDTFLNPNHWFENLHELNNQKRYTISEIPYKEFIPARALRRMKKIVRMGVCAAKQALEDADIKKPDGIIIGSSLGIVEDTEIFLNQLIDQKEEMMNPTAFIQSTHNTVAGAIALMLECNAHNLTYSQLNASFESCILDAFLMMEDKDIACLLVGGLDEQTDESYLISSYTGSWKTTNPKHISDLYKTQSKGAVSGEGASFFLLSKNKEKAKSAIRDVRIYNTLDGNDPDERFFKFMDDHSLDLKDIDLVLLGNNGDTTDDAIYLNLVNGLFKDKNIAVYKNVCGEFATSSAFAYWLANQFITHQHVPDILRLNEHSDMEIRNILIYQHYQNANHCISWIQKV